MGFIDFFFQAEDGIRDPEMSRGLGPEHTVCGGQMSIRAQSRLISVSVTAADRASVLRGLTNGMAVWIYRGFLRIAARGYRLCSPREAELAFTA